MDSYWIEWASLLLRWLHVVTAIAWIGASFYFVWLDQSLQKPQSLDLVAKGVDGELWAVHGGGFYNPQKYLVAPPFLPKNLHWFYWESYTTWMTGFGLFTLMYLANPNTYLIDSRIRELTPSVAVALAIGFLVVGFIVYDLICRIFENRQGVVAILTPLFVALATIAATQLFSGRAAYLVVGAMMATMMTSNVFFWIIPGQRKVLQAMDAGLPVDPRHGRRGKMRSVHNTYFTLPVIFCMISNHSSQLYSHRDAGVILIFVMGASVLIRQFFLLRHKGHLNFWYPAFGSALLLAVVFWVMPSKTQAYQSPGPVPTMVQSAEQSFKIVQQRCYGCHALRPTLMGGGAPKGIAFETPEDLEKYADLIYQQSVALKTMPLGNVTQMTENERHILGQWYQSKTKI